MIAQLGLSILLLLITIYAWTERSRAPVVGFGAMLAATAGLYFVWLPSHATWLAKQAGIGRGVDLILYVWVVISLLVILNLHLKLRSQMELITILAREAAIASACSSDNDN
jgi:small membrane protein